MRAVAAVLAACLLAHPAQAHQAEPTVPGRLGQMFTHTEIEWMERQHAYPQVPGQEGTKCCNEHDVYVGTLVEWRINAARQYEVHVDGQWYRIEPWQLLEPIRPDPEVPGDIGDPSPFGQQALLFYSRYPTGIRIWCFFPEPLM